MIKPLLWADLTWEQMRDLRREGVDICLFPVGGTLQHGPHLPLGTANTLAECVAHAVSSRTAVPVLPTLPFGVAQSHTRRFPGTLSLSPATLSAVLRELLTDVAAYGFMRVLLLSSVRDNAPAIEAALQELRFANPQLQLAHRFVGDASEATRKLFGSDAEHAHAGVAITSLMLHLAPHSVRVERVVDEPERARNAVFAHTTPQLSERGAIGTPTQATRQRGAELFEALVSEWSYLVRRAMNEKPPIEPNAPKTAQSTSHSHHGEHLHDHAHEHPHEAHSHGHTHHFGHSHTHDHEPRELPELTPSQMADLARAMSAPPSSVRASEAASLFRAPVGSEN